MAYDVESDLGSDRCQRCGSRDLHEVITDNVLSPEEWGHKFPWDNHYPKRRSYIKCFGCNRRDDGYEEALRKVRRFKENV